MILQCHASLNRLAPRARASARKSRRQTAEGPAGVDTQSFCIEGWDLYAALLLVIVHNRAGILFIATERLIAGFGGVHLRISQNDTMYPVCNFCRRSALCQKIVEALENGFERLRLSRRHAGTS